MLTGNLNILIRDRMYLDWESLGSWQSYIYGSGIFKILAEDLLRLYSGMLVEKCPPAFHTYEAERPTLKIIFQ